MKHFFYPTKRGAVNKRAGWRKKGYRCSYVMKARWGHGWFFKVHGINGFHRKGQKELFYD